MQTGTVSRLWLRGRSWRFEIHFWRNIVHFEKSYICSKKLDVQETNCRFAQFNRIWDHLFGYWIEIGWVACSGVMGFDCFCFLEACLRFQIEPGDLLMLKEIKNLKGRSMWWRILILFPQTSSPRVKKLCCMCSKTMKQWSKWSLKEGVLQWNMFPGLTALHMIGRLVVWSN